MMSTQKRYTILSLYRALLQQASGITETAKRGDALREIRMSFRAHKCESDDATVDKLLVDANNRLSFLKMVTPRLRRQGHQQFAVLEGKLVQLADAEQAGILPRKEKAAVSNWGAGNVDPDQLKRHENLMKRMQFRDGPLKEYPRNVYGHKKW